MLIPRAPGVSRSCQMDGCATSTKIGSWFSRYTYKKGIRTGCPDAPSDGFVSHGLGERQISWLFTRYSKLTFLFVWRLIYIVPGALFLSLMVGRYFMFVMMTLGGSMTIITLRAADRDRGKWCCCQRSWEVIMWSDCRKWLVVTSSCPPTLQVAERGSWQAVVVTCETCLLQSIIRTIVSGWHMLIIRMYCVSRPDDTFINVVWSSLR